MSLELALVVFLAMATVVVLAGTRLAAYGDLIADVTGLGGLFVGTLLLAFATSLPELATDITAAATGAPDLAVADLFGSSMANMAILAIVDLRSRGRAWLSVELGHARVASVAIVLTAVAALGINTPGMAIVDMQDELGQLLGRQVDLGTKKALAGPIRDRVLATSEVVFAA